MLYTEFSTLNILFPALMPVYMTFKLIFLLPTGFFAGIVFMLHSILYWSKLQVCEVKLYGKPFFCYFYSLDVGG